MPAWCSLPDWAVKFDMVQAPGSTDGSEWIRNSSQCGGPMEESYRLRSVYLQDGTPGKFFADLATTSPAVMIISR